MGKKLIVALFALGVVWVQAAQAQDLSATVADLQKQLQAQNARIKELEARQGTANVDKALADMKSEMGPMDFKVYWKDGLRMKSGNGDFSMAIGGRVQYDFGWVKDHGGLQDVLGANVRDGAEMRRGRMYMAGTMYRNIDYKLEVDFTGGDADLKDAYIKIKGLDLGPVKWLQIGHFKEPFSLGQLTSSKYITFMERSLADVFAPGRNAGIMTGGTVCNKRMTWAFGGFRNTDDYGNAYTDRSYHVTGRMTFLPIYENNGAQLLHLGANYSYRETDDTRSVQYRQRPEYHNSLRYVDTGAFAADEVSLFGVEAAAVMGSLHAQAEYMGAYTDGDDNTSSEDMSGVYCQVGYFLTGETRPYKTSDGTFSRVRPLRNFGENGSGAWELKARYSYLDLQETNVQGGRMTDLGAGVNWYLNPNVRIMWDWVHSFLDRDDVTNVDHGGEADIFMMRTQIDF